MFNRQEVILSIKKQKQTDPNLAFRTAAAYLDPTYLENLFKEFPNIDMNSAGKTSKKTALHQAVIKKNIETIKFLFKQKKIKINQRDNPGMTARMYAYVYNNEEIIKIFSNKLKIELAKNDRIYYLLYQAMLEKDPFAVICNVIKNEQLLKRPKIGDLITWRANGKSGKSLLDQAAEHKNEGILYAMLSLTTTNNIFWTPCNDLISGDPLNPNANEQTVLDIIKKKEKYNLNLCNLLNIAQHIYNQLLSCFLIFLKTNDVNKIDFPKAEKLLMHFKDWLSFSIKKIKEHNLDFHFDKSVYYQLSNKTERLFNIKIGRDLRISSYFVTTILYELENYLKIIDEYINSSLPLYFNILNNKRCYGFLDKFNALAFQMCKLVYAHKHNIGYQNLESNKKCYAIQNNIYMLIANNLLRVAFNEKVNNYKLDYIMQQYVNVLANPDNESLFEVSYCILMVYTLKLANTNNKIAIKNCLNNMIFNLEKLEDMQKPKQSISGTFAVEHYFFRMKKPETYFLGLLQKSIIKININDADSLIFLKKYMRIFDLFKPIVNVLRTKALSHMSKKIHPKFTRLRVTKKIHVDVKRYLTEFSDFIKKLQYEAGKKHSANKKPHYFQDKQFEEKPTNIKSFPINNDSKSFSTCVAFFRKPKIKTRGNGITKQPLKYNKNLASTPNPKKPEDDKIEFPTIYPISSPFALVQEKRGYISKGIERKFPKIYLLFENLLKNDCKWVPKINKPGFVTTGKKYLSVKLKILKSQYGELRLYGRPVEKKEYGYEEGKKTYVFYHIKKKH